MSACGPTADSASIHRFSAAAENDFPPLDRTVTDPAVASRLYQEVRALPQRSSQSFCHVLDLGAGDMRNFDDHFEADLLDAFGLYTRGNDLWPTPIPRP